MSAVSRALALVAALTFVSAALACGAAVAPGADVDDGLALIDAASPTSVPAVDGLVSTPAFTATPYGVELSDLLYPTVTATAAPTDTPTAVVTEIVVGLPVAVGGPLVSTPTPMPTFAAAVVIAPTRVVRRVVATPTPFWSTATPSATVTPVSALPTPTAIPMIDLDLARRIGAFDWRSYESEGYVFTRVDEGADIVIRSADVGSDDFDVLECSPDFGVSFSSNENPTYRSGSRFVWVWGENADGSGECWRVAADKDWLKPRLRARWASDDAIDALRARDMALPLEFYSEASGDRRFTMPPFENEYPGVPIGDVWVDSNGRSSVCRPESLPYAVWDEKRGFWAMSDADMLLFDNGSEGVLTQFEADRALAVAEARERGFYLTHEPREDGGYRWFCWAVANAGDVPVLPCYECEDDGVISE